MRQRILACAVILLYLTIIGLVGCGGDSEEDDVENVGSTGISYLIPGDGDNDFPITSAILIAFDGDVSTPSTDNLVFTPGVSGTVSYDANIRTLLFRPSSDLSVHTDYSMTVSGITDVEGNAVSSFTINFTTGLADKESPEIIFSYPEDEQKDIGHDVQIILGFDGPVDRGKLMDGISFSPRLAVSLDDWVLDWGGISGEEVTMIPPVGIEPFDVNEEYTLTISSDSVVDLSDNSMRGDYELEFRTLRYPVEKAINTSIQTLDPQSAWIFVVGKRGGTWIVKWGGTRPQGGPTGGQPSGTITASADGRILDDFEAFATRQGERTTCSVTKGDGNKLTFSTSAAIGNVDNAFGVKFGSTSSYLIFSLTPGVADYINIGTGHEHPSKGTFVLPN